MLGSFILRFSVNVFRLANQKSLDYSLSWLLPICTFSFVCDHLHVLEWGRALGTSFPGNSCYVFLGNIQRRQDRKEKKGYKLKAAPYLCAPCIDAVSMAGRLLHSSVFIVSQRCVYPYPSILKAEMASTSIMVSSWGEFFTITCLFSEPPPTYLWVVSSFRPSVMDSISCLGFGTCKIMTSKFSGMASVNFRYLKVNLKRSPDCCFIIHRREFPEILL